MNQPLRSAFRTGWAAAATLSLALSVTAQTPANPGSPGSPGVDARPPVAASEVAAIDAAWLVERLRPDRPRLVADAQAWAQVRALRREDPAYAAEVAAAVAEARAAMTAPPLEREMTGRRLLPVSREALRRVLLLAFAHRVEDDPAYARAAEACLLRVAGFSDWNPDHFLDVAEMATAVALGLDWLHDDLPPATRLQLVSALREKAIAPLLAADPLGPGDPSPAGSLWWRRAENNWNAVCWGGLVLAALSTAEEEPAAAAEVLRRVLRNNAPYLDSYGPDGVYPEGPSYWSYGTAYQVLLIDALGTALRSGEASETASDASAADLAVRAPGVAGAAFLRSAAFFSHATGPLGLTFNFGDTRASATRRAEPALEWFAADPATGAAVRPDRPLFGNDAGGDDRASRFAPLGLLWRGRGAAGDPAAAAAGPAPGWWGRGVQPVALFRGTWGDPRAAYLATKGGRASANHAHMDAGSFVLDARGVRWVSDPGRPGYESIESTGFTGLFDAGQDSPRWTLRQMHNLGHSTLTLGGRRHHVDGLGELIEARSDAAGRALAAYDLSAPLGLPAGSAVRSFRFDPAGRLVVRDELASLPPGESVRWNLPTPAEARVSADGRSATLTSGGESLRVSLVTPTPADARLAIEGLDADPDLLLFEPPPPTRLLFFETAAPADGRLVLEVELQWADP